jgi:hypothetical protein
MQGSVSERDGSLYFKPFSSRCRPSAGAECAGVSGNTDKERLISPDVTGDVTALSAATLITRYDNELRTSSALFRFVVGQ